MTIAARRVEPTEPADAALRPDIHTARVPRLCRACEARHRGICGALDPAELLRLGRTSTRQTYAAGTTLIAAGERAEHCSNILSGVVKLSKLLADGRQQVVALQFAPDFVGRPFAGDSDVLVEAATDLRVCSFPRRMLETMMTASPAFEARMHRQALRQLDEAREWMMALGRKSAAERVATFLVMLSRHAAAPDGRRAGEIDLPLCRADIADFLGLTAETVSRQLTALRRQGVVDVARSRHVTIRDPAALLCVAAM